ncbi:MAG TPA: caspase family protein [Hyphomicrobiaceae bacterium]|jgi:uncharacterized caspase-like protein
MVRIALALLLSLLLQPTALAEKRVALVIGIDKYDNLGPQAQLRKARSDAAAVARLLKGIGFDVIAREDVTRSAFNNQWQDFINKLARGDIAAFYFAGHGVEFGGRSYLLPRDVPNLKPGRDELVRREALSLQEFLADLREKGTRLNVVILDACRDNPFEQGAERSVGSRRGLAVAEPPPEGTFIMYSAGAGESALDQLDDTDRDPNSVYTRHLLPLLKTPGMPLTEVAKQVRVLVRQMAETVQHRQTPAYYDQVLGRVCLAGGECGARVTGGGAAEAWDRTNDTTSIAALEAFIRRFGDTYYGDLAKVRLTELEQSQAAEKKMEEEAKAKAEAERQRLSMLKAEQDRKQGEEIEQERLNAEDDRKRVAEAATVKKKADEEAQAKRAAEEAEQRQVMLKAAQERKRAEDDARTKRAADEASVRERLVALKAGEDAGRPKSGSEVDKSSSIEKEKTKSERAKLAALSKVEKPAEAHRFDGTWTITTKTCFGSAQTTRSHTIKIVSGTISGVMWDNGSVSGSVSPSGVARWSVAGIADLSGIFRGRSGSGKIRPSQTNLGRGCGTFEAKLH